MKNPGSMSPAEFLCITRGGNTKPQGIEGFVREMPYNIPTMMPLALLPTTKGKRASRWTTYVHYAATRIPETRVHCRTVGTQRWVLKQYKHTNG